LNLINLERELSKDITSRSEQVGVARRDGCNAVAARKSNEKNNNDKDDTYEQAR